MVILYYFGRKSSSIPSLVTMLTTYLCMVSVLLQTGFGKTSSQIAVPPSLKTIQPILSKLGPPSQVDPTKWTTRSYALSLVIMCANTVNQVQPGEVDFLKMWAPPNNKELPLPIKEYLKTGRFVMAPLSVSECLDVVLNLNAFLGIELFPLEIAEIFKQAAQDVARGTIVDLYLSKLSEADRNFILLEVGMVQRIYNCLEQPTSPAELGDLLQEFSKIRPRDQGINSNPTIFPPSGVTGRGSDPLRQLKLNQLGLDLLSWVIENHHLQNQLDELINSQALQGAAP
ncbi:hypothetical protein RF11_11347 [Thelohanellus kitauei]|uniref:Uncharacterized protein n=1 Tax=Thelohanellus kitauei TaxID=669202 RepID=A0A0C2N0S8_THEKT|nr:hypothetical protein RF11_11347 [Thelohanellus kitauei]